MLMNIWVRDKTDGHIHQLGTDEHDSLEVIDGKVEYVNMQNMAGTYDDYEFVEAPDMDDYVSVTIEELYLNKRELHRDFINQMKKQNKKALKDTEKLYKKLERKHKKKHR